MENRNIARSVQQAWKRYNQGVTWGMDILIGRVTALCDRFAANSRLMDVTVGIGVWLLCLLCVVLALCNLNFHMPPMTRNGYPEPVVIRLLTGVGALSLACALGWYGIIAKPTGMKSVWRAWKRKRQMRKAKA